MKDLGYYAAAVINFMLALVATLLGLRFVLKLFGANANNEIVNWIYASSGEVLGPFRGIFPQADLEGGFVIEFSTVFAMLAYLLIGMFAFYLIEVLTPKTDSKRR